MQRERRIFAGGSIMPFAGLAAIALALVAQQYFNLRVRSADAGYVFLCAIALFIAAFPRGRQDTWPRWVKQALQLILAAASAIIFVRVYSNLVNGQNFLETVILAIIPLFLLGTAFGGSRTTSRPDDGPDVVALPAQPSPLAAKQAWLPFIILGLILSVGSFIYLMRQGLSNDGVVITIAGVIVLLIGVYRIDAVRGRVSIRSVGDVLPLRLEIILLLGIVAVGAIIRFYNLAQIPFGVWYDEAQAGQEAIRFMQGIPFTPMGTYTANNPSLYFYLVAAAFKITGPSLVTLRFVSGLFGVLAIPAIYLFLRFTIGWRGALIGAFLLAVSSWAVDFSRLAMCCNTEAPPFEALTLYFMLRGLRYGKASDFAWGGVALGIGQYTYAGFRLFPIIIGAYLLYGLFLNKDRVRQSIPGLILFGTMTVAVFIPMGTWIIQHSQEFFYRTNQTSVFAGKNTTQERLGALENSLRRHLMMFNVTGDSNGRHGLPNAPAIDWISSALLVIGFAYSLYRWRSPTYLMLVLFFVVMMASGVMSLDWEAPQQARTVVAIPALYAIVAMVGGKLWGAWDRLSRAQRSLLAGRVVRVGGVVAVAGVLGTQGYLNINRYFNEQMNNRDAWYAFSTVETAQARRILELGVNRFRIYTQSQDTPSFQLLVGGDSPARPVDDRFFKMIDHLPLHEKADKDVLYLIDSQFNTLDPAEVLRYYPNAIYNELKDPFGKVFTWEFQVPAKDITDLQALTVNYYNGATPSGSPVSSERRSSLAVDWSSPPLAQPFSTVWDGQIFFPNAGTYTFSLKDASGSVQATVGGNTVLDTAAGKATGQASFPKGMQPVSIRTSDSSGFTLTWTKPDGTNEVIPAVDLIALPPSGHGLAGKYYAGPDWAGQPAFVQVDATPNWRWHPDPFNGQWSGEWRATLDAPVSGPYRFQVVCNDKPWVIIDGQTYVNGTKGSSGFQVTLTAGHHDLVLRYSNVVGYAELRLFWLPPNTSGDPAPIPTKYLTTP